MSKRPSLSDEKGKPYFLLGRRGMRPGVDFINICARLFRPTFSPNFCQTFSPNFCQTFLTDFFACKIWRFLWRTAFGERLTNLANFYLRNCHKYYWWNWTANFSPNAVRRRLFAWYTKFGEIGPGSKNKRKSVSDQFNKIQL